MGMSGPGSVHLLVKVTGQSQSLFIGLLVAVGIGGYGIVLLGTIGSRHKVQDGIVALAQLVGGSTALSGDVLPHLGCNVCGDVECTTVADDEGGLGAGLGQPHKGVLKSQLCLQDGQLALVVELLVGRYGNR